MKFINPVGVKTREWQKARVGLVKEALVTGRLTLVSGALMGICQDCKKWRILTPDHIKKRSLGGLHEKSNIDWVCSWCHDKRDNQGDPMKKKPKSKKSAWEEPHKCRHCKAEISMLICPHCDKMSILLKSAVSR